MEAVTTKHNITTNLTLKEAMSAYFNNQTLESTELLFWKFFQCWVTRDCKIKADLTDEEVALFFDQLTDLVTAVYAVHQANGANVKVIDGGKGEGDGHGS